MTPPRGLGRVGAIRNRALSARLNTMHKVTEGGTTTCGIFTAYRCCLRTNRGSAGNSRAELTTRDLLRGVTRGSSFTRRPSSWRNSHRFTAPICANDAHHRCVPLPQHLGKTLDSTRRAYRSFLAKHLHGPAQRFLRRIDNVYIRDLPFDRALLEQPLTTSVLRSNAIAYQIELRRPK